MALEKYTKDELHKIVKLYNLGLEEKEIKQKKVDLIKTMQSKKKTFDYKHIDSKIKKADPKKSVSKPKKKKTIKQIKGQTSIIKYI